MDAQRDAPAKQDATPGEGAENGPTKDVNVHGPNIQVEQIEDFATTLAEWESGLKAIKEGDVVSGKVLKVMEKEVIVDIGYKSEGIINIEEFRGPDRQIQVAAGDQVDVLLEKTEDGDGYVVLSKEKAIRLKVWDRVEKAFETGEAVLGRVIERIKGGLKVDIGLPAFLPGSLVDSRPVRHLESLIGQELEMKVI